MTALRDAEETESSYIRFVITHSATASAKMGGVYRTPRTTGGILGGILGSIITGGNVQIGGSDRRAALATEHLHRNMPSEENTGNIGG